MRPITIGVAGGSGSGKTTVALKSWSESASTVWPTCRMTPIIEMPAHLPPRNAPPQLRPPRLAGQ